MPVAKIQGRDRSTKGPRKQPKRVLSPQNEHKPLARRLATPLLCVLPGLLTVVLYGSAGSHPFTNYDDPAYVSENVHVRAGLTWSTVRWAFYSVEASNWHPVTWLSHAADCELHGTEPSGHHWTNVVIHSLNGILLFLLLNWATGAKWQSLMVALLFAVHPLNVESVAWISERKNVLSTFFLLLTLAAYGWYSQRPSVKRYALVVACFALGLMAKPMLVTLPLTLLLIDYWPLRRMTTSATAVQPLTPRHVALGRLVIEKIPLFMMSLGSAAITMVAQRTSLAPSQRFPISLRVQNALVSYVLYLKKAVWPSSLALFYPHPESIPRWQWIAALVGLVLVSVVVWRQRSSRPFLLVGWCWFLGTLVPVLGIVQVGAQALADRYAYVPLIGIFVAVVWLGTIIPAGIPRYAIGAGIVLALSLMTWRQLGYWKTNTELWSHTLAVTKNNLIAEDKLGSALQASGRQEEALSHFVNALRLDPQDALANFSMGADLQWHGHLAEAIPYYETTIRQHTDARLLADTYQNLATDYMQMGDQERARENFLRALNANPALTTVFAGLGELAGEPARSLSQAVVQSPTAEGYAQLARAFQQAGRVQEAALAYTHAK